MRYIVKHVTEYKRTDPAWYFFHKNGTEWSIWDDEIGGTLVGYKTREEAEKVAKQYESEPDDFS